MKNAWDDFCGNAAHDALGNRIGVIAAERRIRPGSTLPVGMGEQIFDQIGADIAADIRTHMNAAP